MVLILGFKSAVASHESDATAGSSDFDLRTGARGAEHQLRGRSNSNDSIWFVALAEEQWTLITRCVEHGISFGCVGIGG